MPKEKIKRVKTIELSFPEESGLVVEEILKKYGWEEIQKKGIKKWFKSENSSEKKRLFEELPGSKISKLIREYAEGKIAIANIGLLLRERFSIPDKKAEEIAQELRKKILNFIKPIVEEKEVLPLKEAVPEKKPVIKSEKPGAPREADIYRELVE